MRGEGGSIPIRDAHGVLRVSSEKKWLLATIKGKKHRQFVSEKKRKTLLVLIAVKMRCQHEKQHENGAKILLLFQLCLAVPNSYYDIRMPA